MTDITLDPVQSGYNLSKFNNNFDILEDVINNGILHTTGGNNIMQQILDMNSRDVINVNTLYATEGNFATRIMLGGIDYEVVIQAIADAAQDSADLSAQSALDSQTSADASEASNQLSLAHYEQFQDQYWGAYPVEPALSPIGNPATSGDLYYDETALQMKVYSNGVWRDVSSLIDGIRDSQDFTNVAGQDTFNITYDPGFLDAFLNGVKLVNGVDYVSTTGTEAVLTTPVALATDVVCLVGFGKANYIDTPPITGIRKETTLTGVAGQTVFTFDYLPGYTDVLINGVRIINGVDYIATTGVGITLTTPITSATDYIQMIGYNEVDLVALGTAAPLDVQTSPTDATAGAILNNETTSIGGNVNFTEANLNPNVFSCTGVDKRIVAGFAASATVAVFFLPTSLTGDPSSIAVTGTFYVKDSFAATVTGGVAVVPTLDAGGSSPKTTVIVVTGLSGLAINDILQLTSTDGTSEITVNA